MEGSQTRRGSLPIFWYAHAFIFFIGVTRQHVMVIAREENIITIIDTDNNSMASGHGIVIVFDNSDDCTIYLHA